MPTPTRRLGGVLIPRDELALKAELARCRGGHLPALQAGVEAMTPEAQRLLLNVLRDLRQEADAERSKRRQGVFF